MKRYFEKRSFRGDGLGEDILENLKTISKIPREIKDKDVPNLLEIRCEILLVKKIFRQSKIILLIQEMLPEDP